MNYVYNLLNTIAEKKKSHFWIFFIVLLLLSLLMIYSYKLFPSFDFYFHYKRFNVLMEALKNGSYPIYIDSTAANGYGYATKWFYCDLILVPFAAIGLLTSAAFAYQFMWFTMTVLCGVFMYCTVNRIYKNSYTAFIGSILYTFCVYRLLDLFVRSALGEALSFTFLPIVFLGIYEILKGDYKKWYILTIGYSLMIFTHVLSTFLTFFTMLILLAIYYKDFIKERKRIYYLIIAGFATIVITAYFLFPLLEQMASGSFYYQTVVKAHPDDHKQNLNWIVWGLFSGIIHPKQIFIPATGILLTWAISLRLFVTEKKSTLLKSVDVGVIIGLVFILLASSLVPWTVFPFNKLYFIQLPWRLYEFVSYFFAVAGGYYLASILKSNLRRFLGAALVVLCTIFVITSSGRDFQYENSRKNINETPTKNTNNYHLYGMEYIPSKFPSIDYLEQRGEKIICNNNDIKINNFKKEKGTTSFDILTTQTGCIELPMFYYKGYAATINNHPIPIQESEKGLVEIVTNESGHIKVWYEGTTMQKISPYVSLIGLIGLCVYIIRTRKKSAAK
ncbi:MAG: hypothetical protein ACLVKO_05450 [Dysgonomonas sp.]